jgi:RNA polymerase sigma factor (sigma-70 family)
MTGADNAPSQPHELAPKRVDAWAGSEVAYATAYRSMLRIAYALTGSGPTAEDIVHDVFVAAGPRFAELRDPVPYLHRSVVNRCRSLHRQTARRRLKPVDIAEHAFIDAGLTDLREALMTLPLRRRSAIVLRYLCGLSDDEIATALNCRRATVRTLVHRGLAELREVIK